jgi:non-ribosomal peptide synthetase component F
VPLDPAYPAARVRTILEDVTPSVTIAASAMPADLAKFCGVQLFLRSDQLAGYPETNVARPCEMNAPAFIIYTSGTTGRPKGVVLSYRNLAHYISTAQKRYGYSRGDVIPAFARFTFSITLFEVLSPLAAGGKLIVLEREHILDLDRLSATLQRVTAFHASPSLLRRLVAHLDAANLQRDFAGVRHVSSGGDVVPPDLMENLKRIFQHAQVFVIYGSSEISCMGCTYEVPRNAVMTKTLVGKPFDNVTLRICDAQGNLVPMARSISAARESAWNTCMRWS